MARNSVAEGGREQRRILQFITVARVTIQPVLRMDETRDETMALRRVTIPWEKRKIRFNMEEGRGTKEIYTKASCY